MRSRIEPPPMKSSVKSLRRSLLRVAVPSSVANGAMSATSDGSLSPWPVPWKKMMLVARSRAPSPPSWL